MEKILEVSGIVKTYKNGRGIYGIDLSLNKGDVFGLLGPNGAGKTTLLKCVTGLLRPDNGTITIFQKDVINDFKEAIRPVGAYVGSATVYKHLTAFQNLKLAIRFYPELPISRIDEVLEQVGLMKYKNERTSSFSMGMLQRLELALVLIAHPKLVVLDEPTNGLDIDGILLFRKVIRELSSSGVTILISSHVTSELENLCNLYGILMNGSLVYSGSMLDRSRLVSMEEIYLERIGELGHERTYL